MSGPSPGTAQSSWGTGARACSFPPPIGAATVCPPLTDVHFQGGAGKPEDFCRTTSNPGGMLWSLLADRTANKNREDKRHIFGGMNEVAQRYAQRPEFTVPLCGPPCLWARCPPGRCKSCPQALLVCLRCGALLLLAAQPSMPALCQWGLPCPGEVGLSGLRTASAPRQWPRAL